MNDPELYHKAYINVKRDGGRFIEKYLKKFQWRADGSDILLDVGSGTGQVFMDYTYRQLPKNFHKAIMSDISTDMLQCCQKYYGNVEKCEHRVLDIMTKNELPSDLKGKIHHLTSIFLIHWLSDVKTGLKNMYDLLSPEGGDCLIVFMPSNTLFDANIIMKSSEKWGHYLKDVKEFMPIPDYSADRVENFSHKLEEAGFSNIVTEQTSYIFSEDSWEAYKAPISSVCNIMNHIPQDRKSEFLDDIANAMVDVVSKDKDAKLMDSKYAFRYDIIVAHARKCAQ